MRKVYLSIIFSLGIALAYSQPVISNIIPNVGDTFIILQQDTYTDPGSAGENMTWDFSDATINEIEAQYLVKDPDEVEASDQFPDATLVLHFDVEFISINNFVSYANNTFTEYGTQDEAGTFGTTYEDPKEHFTFPINYMDTGSDNYSGTVNSPGSGGNDITGSYSFEVDGYGTIITPNGTYDDVLRLKVTGEEELSFMGFATNSEITEYYWYSNDYPFPLFVVHQDISMVSGAPNDTANTTIMLSSYTSNPTGVESIDGGHPISISPNPAQNFIHIDFESQQAAVVRIYNSVGKRVMQEAINSSGRIDVADLSKGIYVAEVTVDNIPYGRKPFVKE